MDLLIEVDWKTGTLKTSKRNLSKITSIPETTILRMLKKLEKNDMITVVRSKDYSKISIVNWSKYQSNSDEKSGPQVDHLVDQQVDQPHQFKNNKSGPPTEPHSEYEVDRYKEKEYINNINVPPLQEEKPLKEKKSKYDDIDVRLTNRLFDLMRKNHDHITKKPKESDFVNIRRINSLDGKSYESIEWIIEWSQKHEFWQNNILSTGKLRKQMDVMMSQAKADKAKLKKDSIIKGYSTPTDKKSIPVREKQLTEAEKTRGKLIKDIIASGYRMADLKNLKSKTNQELESMLHKK